MSHIFNAEYNSKIYTTKSTLRVGWKAEYSPFSNDFNPKFLKRIRAYDNNGKDFDIQMNFDLLKENRYISDGDVNTIVIPNRKKDKLNPNVQKKVKIY